MPEQFLDRADVRAGFEKFVAPTSTGLLVDTLAAEAKKRIAGARDPRWKKPCTDLTHLPMQEVLKFLRAIGYRAYIEWKRIFAVE